MSDEVRHRMIGGSHERPNGPECRCGAEWDWWGDRCVSANDKCTCGNQACKFCGGWSPATRESLTGGAAQ